MNVILSVTNILFPIITFPYLTDIIKPGGTGKVGFAFSVIEYFNIFAQLGIPTYGIRVCSQVRDDKEKLTQTAHELLFINLCMTALTYVVFAIAVCTIPILKDERLLFIIASFSMLLTTIGMEWLYKALEEYKFITVRSVIFKIIAMVAMFLLVHNEDDYLIYGAISVLATTGSMILNFINVHKYIDMKPRQSYDFKRHLKPAAMFLAMACATTVYTNLDTVMLRLMTTKEDTGYYYASIKIKYVLLSIITSLGAVLLPRVSYYVEKKRMDEFKNVITLALKFVLIVSTPAVFFFIMTAKPCILFLSGEDFYDAILPMQILVPTVLVIGISNLLGIQVLVPMSKEKVLLYIEIGGGLLDFMINILLIPRLRSSGAAIGTLAAEIFVTVSLMIYLSKDLKEVFGKLEILKILVSFVIASLFSFGAFILTGNFISNLRLPEFYMFGLNISEFFSGYHKGACLVRIFVPFIVYCIAYVPCLCLMKEKLTVDILSRFLHSGKKTG